MSSKWNTFILLSLLGYVAIVQTAVKLSDFVTPCSLKDPNLETCLTTQGKAMLPHLIRGVKEWGILPMDPLLLPYITLQQGNVENGGLSLNGTDTSHYGWKDLNIKTIRMNPDNYELEVEASIPSYRVQGTYAVAGKVISLSLVGTGAFNCTFKPVDLKMKISLEPEHRGGKTFLKISKTTCDASVKHIIFQLDNLFGNKQLSDTMNAVLTENSADVYKDFKIPFQNLITDTFDGILSRFFSKVPMNHILKQEA